MLVREKNLLSHHRRIDFMSMTEPAIVVINPRKSRLSKPSATRNARKTLNECSKEFDADSNTVNYFDTWL